MNKDYLDERFFVIDSDNLADVKTRLYGYYLDENGITADKSYSGGGAPDSGSGAYVLVTRSGSEITIEQDFCGSYGLYLFQKGSYFALSNSFLYLTDYIKSRYPLSVNKDYVDYFLVADLASVAYGQTMIKEIRVLDRNAVVHIHIPDKTFETRVIVPEENTVDLNSEEGMQILDRWYSRWTGVIRSIAKETGNVTADLSGGFDTRLTFMLVKSAGVDLNRINICSLHDERHTHKEDYEIASQIASYYGFSLNDETMLHKQRNPYSIDKAISLSCSVSLCFTKQLIPLIGSFKEPRYRVTGAGGGCVRGYWDLPVGTFLEEQRSHTEKYPPRMAKRLASAQERVLKKAISEVAAKYGITDLQSRDLPPLLNKEDRVRNHFGKDAVESYLVNDIKITPLIDKDLHRLRLNDEKCSDKDLLVSVILHRYCPELLNFKFDSGRSISAGTLQYGAELAAKYPSALSGEREEAAKEAGDFLMDAADETAQAEQKVEPATFDSIRERYMKYFNSYQVRREFTAYFGEDVDRVVRRDVQQRKHNPLYNVYLTLAVTKILNDVRTSRNCHGENICDYFNDVSRFRNPDPFCGNEPERLQYYTQKKAKSGIRYAKKQVYGKLGTLKKIIIKG